MEDIRKYIDYDYIPIICGPTASGKSGLALDICRKTGGELISCDSMQIYKGLDIGTAKATREEQAEIPHHMIDIVEPGTNYSVSDYVFDALNSIEDVLKRGKLPVICGGTGQYVSALYYGLDYGKKDVPEEITAALYKEYEEDGIDDIYERLLKIDPEATTKIHKNNTRRVIRALAVSMSGENIFSDKNKESAKGAKYPFKLFQIVYEDRNVLYERINHRVDIMAEDGLLDEVKKLYSLDIDRKSTCFQAIGYKEFASYLNGEMDLEQALYEVRLRSRHYAKRQLTWFRYMEGINQLEYGDSSNVQKVISEIC